MVLREIDTQCITFGVGFFGVDFYDFIGRTHELVAIRVPLLVAPHPRVFFLAAYVTGMFN